jgi:hypothetical protein
LKSTVETKKSIPKAKKSDVVDVEALPEDVEASTVNIASPSIMKKDEPIAKWLRPSQLTQSQGLPSSNISTFELLHEQKGMALTPPPTSSCFTSFEIILNNSFVRMVEEKQHTTPRFYDNTMAFLMKVLIPISIFCFTIFSYSLFLLVLSIIHHIFISLYLIIYL